MSIRRRAGRAANSISSPRTRPARRSGRACRSPGPRCRRRSSRACGRAPRRRWAARRGAARRDAHNPRPPARRASRHTRRSRREASASRDPDPRRASRARRPAFAKRARGTITRASSAARIHRSTTAIASARTPRASSSSRCTQRRRPRRRPPAPERPRSWARRGIRGSRRSKPSRAISTTPSDATTRPSIAVSSRSSRSTAASGDSPASTRPPGRVHSPAAGGRAAPHEQGRARADPPRPPPPPRCGAVRLAGGRARDDSIARWTDSRSCARSRKTGETRSTPSRGRARWPTSRDVARLAARVVELSAAYNDPGRARARHARRRRRSAGLLVRARRPEGRRGRARARGGARDLPLDRTLRVLDLGAGSRRDDLGSRARARGRGLRRGDRGDLGRRRTREALELATAILRARGGREGAVELRVPGRLRVPPPGPLRSVGSIRRGPGRPGAERARRVVAGRRSAGNVTPRCCALCSTSAPKTKEPSS